MPIVSVWFAVIIAESCCFFILGVYNISNERIIIGIQRRS
jgi:hypothetical protein